MVLGDFGNELDRITDRRIPRGSIPNTAEIYRNGEKISEYIGFRYRVGYNGKEIIHTLEMIKEVDIAGNIVKADVFECDNPFPEEEKDMGMTAEVSM
jgi:hypothetical protein